MSEAVSHIPSGEAAPGMVELNETAVINLAVGLEQRGYGNTPDVLAGAALRTCSKSLT